MNILNEYKKKAGVFMFQIKYLKRQRARVTGSINFNSKGCAKILHNREDLAQWPYIVCIRTQYGLFSVKITTLPRCSYHFSFVGEIDDWAETKVSRCSFRAGLVAGHIQIPIADVKGTRVPKYWRWSMSKERRFANQDLDGIKRSNLQQISLREIRVSCFYKLFIIKRI